MAILPLPQFEADLEADRKAYEALQAPKSMVVRFGVMRLVGEYPYEGDLKPGCGSKIVARTHRGTELCDMLTTTCPNGGCGHSVSRKEILTYVENSGGKDYPFFTDGRILRLATIEDLNKQAALDAQADAMVRQAREIVQRVGLSDQMKMVEAEPLLGGERLTFYFYSEERVDFRPVVMELAAIHHTRIELRQVGARGGARPVPDYEKCGQHCCCRQFLKVLKPVSMKQAKIQKATLDPLKISGRCGRLMCCLRYEENTYDELKKNLPRKKTPVMTPDGPGIVIDSQILTQLVLVRLDATNEDGAYPVESLTKPNPQRAGQPGRPQQQGDDADDEPGAPVEGEAPPSPSGGAPSQSPPRNPQQQQSRGSGPGPRPDNRGAQQRGQQQGQGRGGPPQHGGQQGQRGQPPRGQQSGQSQGQPRGPRQGQPQPGQGPRPNQPPQNRREDVNERDRRRAQGLVPPSDFRTSNPPGANPNQPSSETQPPAPPPPPRDERRDEPPPANPAQ